MEHLILNSRRLLPDIITASVRKGASARASVIATCTAASASLILPFFTAFALSFFTLDSILAMPESRKRASDSIATTSKPFSAAV